MSNKPEHTADISAELRTLSRSAKQYGLQPTVYGKPIDIYFAELADRAEAAAKREVDALKQRLAELNAEIAAKDEVIMRLNDALAEEQGRKMTTAEKTSALGNAAKLPDGWKMYDKYQIRHTDGTPLKGKRYFVLRLDSDDPLEAARVAAAMSAYKGETPQGNLAKLRAVVEDLLYMARRYVKKMPATETVIFDSKTHETLKTIDYYKTIEKAEAALAAPSRNCDMYGGDFKMLHTAWFDWTGSPSGHNADGTVKLTFAEYLLATTKKGSTV